MAEKTVHKWIWVWDYDKEEQWLNEMARQGWALKQAEFLTYHFESCAPGEYAIRLQLLEDMPTTAKSQEYISFVESTGAEYAGRMAKWVYFRKRAADGPFELFSDLDSRIRHTDRILQMLGLIGGANLLIGCVNLPRIGGIAWVNLVCAAVLGYACWRIWQKRSRLEQDRAMHE